MEGPGIISRWLHDRMDMGSPGQSRRRDFEYRLELSLEELYVGVIKKLPLSGKVPCSNCSGEGPRSVASITCAGCQGCGMIRTIRHIGPSSQPWQLQLCYECMGAGEVNSCAACKGHGFVTMMTSLHAVVEKGMQDRQTFTLPGEMPETSTVDVACVIQQREHPKFTRMGDDLFYEHKLSLTEALFGFRFALTHLDGRKLLMKSKPGEVVKPGSYKAIYDEGMPVYKRPFMKGKLYIRFNVEFPNSLTLGQRDLPPSNQRLANELRAIAIDECEETTLHDVNIEDEMQRTHAQACSEEASDEDDDMHCPGGCGGVQCTRQ